MKLIKHINNNFALAEDSVGNIVVVQGKGIGFGMLPRELTSFENVTRTYYDIDKSCFDIINTIPNEIITLSSKVVDRVMGELDCGLSPNIVFTLADHIYFSIERYRKNISVKPPIINDVKFLYEKEYAIGLYTLDLIREELHVILPKEEAAFIALHIINSIQTAADQEAGYFIIMSDIVKIIEERFDLKINTDGFNYSRFASHMNYLFQRFKNKEVLQSKNERLFESVKNEYSEEFACVEEIADYLSYTLQIDLNNEEKMYLMLHINRLCSREVNSQ
ncbi:MAG: PRD domain-containing protein [Erysipelotrichaceae bacterium]|nr:PRD domain-containing protein [Erysipelotrichaceae bacterium]